MTATSSSAAAWQMAKLCWTMFKENCPQEAKDACDAAVKALKEGSVDLKALFD